MAEFLQIANAPVQDKNGQPRPIEQGTVVLLYFSAHWCPPCRQFTPMLKRFYEAAKAAGEKFEVIFLSSDRSGAEMTSYMNESHGDWACLPHGHQMVKMLADQYAVRGIPGVVIAKGNGQKAEPAGDPRQDVAMGAQTGQVGPILKKWRAAAGIEDVNLAKLLPPEVEVEVCFKSMKRSINVLPGEGFAMLQFQIFSLTEVPDGQQRIWMKDVGAITDDASFHKGLTKAGTMVVLSNASVWDKTEAFPEAKTAEFRQQQSALLSFKIKRVVEKSIDVSMSEPHKMQIAQKVQQFVGHWGQCQLYEDRDTMYHALSKVPLDKLHDEAIEALAASDGKDKTYSDALLRRVLHWFKHDFFKWADGPPNCDEPKEDVVPSGSDQPNAEEQQGLAQRVEIYKSKKTGKTYRYPRYNHPKKLLDTRWGRCGEFANAFCCVCRALGYEARWVHDVTDHVWVEVWSDERQRWIHLDSCENAFDAPKLYESGWGKKLSYIHGFARDHMANVAPRYVVDWNECLKSRRDPALENAYGKVEKELSTVFSDEFVGLFEPKEQAARLKVIGDRARLEASEIAKHKAGQNPTGEGATSENVGRITGDQAWREQRGEAGANAEARKNAEDAMAGKDVPAASSTDPASVTSASSQKDMQEKFQSIVKEKHAEFVKGGMDPHEAALKAMEEAKKMLSGN